MEDFSLTDKRNLLEMFVMNEAILKELCRLTFMRDKPALPESLKADI